MSAIGSPISTRVFGHWESGTWDDIVKMRVDPRGYTDAETYFRDVSAVSLLRKCSDLPTSFDRRANALKNWWKGEESCKRTNLRLAPFLEDGIALIDEFSGVYQHIVGIRKVVKAILGKAPEKAALIPRHGPGATYSDKAQRSTIADKMNNPASITRGALFFMPEWLETAWGRSSASASPRRDPSFVRGNRFATAPKDAEKDRPIGAEPSINIFFQLSLGKVIRRRLKNVGIDLSNAQDTHKQVACEASISGRLATLDLSNASDTVSYSLVKLLVPHDWFELLDELRSPFTSVDGKWIRLEKFSSMGNGFTFELETLIFYSIVRYVEMYLTNEDGMDSRAYGDDIICSAEIAQPVIKILNYLGFSINTEKSFVDGPFRESCGGDYFHGQAVRPYYMEEFPCEPETFISAANALRAKITDHFGGLGDFARPWFTLLDQLPSGIRACRGPQALGDIVIHDDESRWVTRWRSQTKYIRVYRPARYNKVPLGLFDSDVVLACATYGVPWNRGFLIPRDAVSGYKVGWLVAWGLGGDPLISLPRTPGFENWAPVQDRA